jgi:hypothetical protein
MATVRQAGCGGEQATRAERRVRYGFLDRGGDPAAAIGFLKHRAPVGRRARFDDGGHGSDRHSRVAGVVTQSLVEADDRAEGVPEFLLERRD